MSRALRRFGQKRDWVVLALLVLAAIFLTADLEDGLLWQDEAETAVLARRTIEYGYPRAFDGYSMVEATPFRHGPGEAWIYSPWLPFYYLGAVFRIFGESTQTARLPFALLGWLSILLTWRLARRLTGDVRVHRLTLALLTFSVPFLLHMRQCRYYGMTTALVVGSCLAYLTWLKKPRLSHTLVLAGILVLLFHTNFGFFIPVAMAMAFHLMKRGSAESHRRVWIVVTAVAVTCVPWILFSYQPSFLGAPSAERVEDHLEFYVRITNKYLAPLAAMLLITLALRLAGVRLWIRNRSMQREGLKDAWLLVLVVAVTFLFLLIPDQRHMRYLISVLPLMAIGVAVWLSRLIALTPRVGWVVAGLTIFTSALQSWPIRAPLVDFAYELTHDYRGPMEGVIEHLNRHAHDGQTAKIPYDDRTVLFYTPLRLERPSRFAEETFPDWIILRKPWLPEGFLESGYFERIQQQYERIDLSAPDIQWQNREDPGSHRFRSVTDGPAVVIYRKRET